MRGNSQRGVARRTFLKTTAGLGVGAGLAGCSSLTGGSGGESSGPTDMVMTTATETTAAYAMSQGISAVINENAEGVRVDARPSEGTSANVGRLQRGESQIAYIQNWVADKLMNGEEPYDKVDFQPNQVMHFYDLAWFFASANDGWNDIGAIESDSRVSPTPRGSGTAPMLEEVLSFATDDYERVSIDYGAQGSAMSEGRLDAGVATYVNLAVEPGWLQEMKGQTDLRVLASGDDVISQMKEHPGIVVSEVEMSQFDGYAYTPETLHAPTLSHNFVVRNDFSYDAVYEFLSTLYENREGLGEYHGLLNAHAEGDWWVNNAYEGVPFHPAAADFYEEQGLWSDAFERGEE